MKMYRHVFMTFFVTCVLASVLGARTQVFFSPDDQLTKKFVELIRSAKKSLIGAIYLISDKTIATEFVEAKKRGIDIKLVVDQMSTYNYGKAPMLAQEGIEVFLYSPQLEKTKEPRDFFNNDPIMHNKFLVVDSRVVWTGSFNWTVAANRKNQENAVIIDERDVCDKYSKQFNVLTNTRCQRFKPDAKNIVPEDNSIDESDEYLSKCFLLDINQGA